MGRTTLRLCAATAALASLLAVTGCADSVKKQAEDAARSNGVDLNLDDPNNPKVDTTEGGVAVGSLPRAYPIDAVPVVDGDVVVGSYTKNPPSWNVTIKAGDDKSKEYDAAAGVLSGKGCEVKVDKVDNGTSVAGELTCGKYDVLLATTDTNGIVVNYSVSQQ